MWGIFLTNYLGVPLSPKPLFKTFWANISKKIQKKLNSWKYSLLSKGGKITLINFSLSSLLTYQLSIFKASSSIYKNIEQTWRNFFWKHPKENHKLHLIRWSIITSPKEKRGLGINRIKDTNSALLNKWIWRFIHEDRPLWKRIILAKYDCHIVGDFPSKGKFSSIKAPWHSIIKGVEWFRPQILWKIGNEESLSFWHNIWHQNSSLSLYYLRLYAISTKQKSLIKEMWNLDSLDWDLLLRRQLRS